MDTKIHNRIWANPDFIELNDSEKLCLFWALTNMNSCGYVSVSGKKLARDIEAAPESLKGALKIMFKDGADVSEGGVWLKGYIGEQLGSGEKLVRSKIFSTVKRHAEEQCPEEVRELIYEAYPEVRDREPLYPQKGAYKGAPKGEGERVGVGGRERGREGKSKGGRDGLGIGGGDGIRSNEAEEAKAIELEVAEANQQSPSASHYLDYE